MLRGAGMTPVSRLSACMPAHATGPPTQTCRPLRQQDLDAIRRFVREHLTYSVERCFKDEKVSGELHEQEQLMILNRLTLLAARFLVLRSQRMGGEAGPDQLLELDQDLRHLVACMHAVVLHPDLGPHANDYAMPDAFERTRHFVNNHLHAVADVVSVVRRGACTAPGGIWHTT